MSDYSDLNLKAQAAIDAIGTLSRAQRERDFNDACTPQVVQALIAENERLRENPHMRAIRSLRGDCADLIAERDQLKAENEALCAKVSNLNVSGFAEAFYTVAEKLGVTGARPVSPMQVFASEVLPALQSAIKDAERYRWMSTEGNWVARFHGKWRAHVGEYGDKQPTDWYPSCDEAIDAAMANGENP